MNQVELKVKIVRSGVRLPEYQTKGAAGLDLRAAIKQEVWLAPGERRIIPTGIAVSLPEGYLLDVRPRSGIAWEAGVTVLNSPGTVDPDYRGEIGVLLINFGNKAFLIKPGDRIAQGVVIPFARVKMKKVFRLPATSRGKGGYGHTGK